MRVAALLVVVGLLAGCGGGSSRVAHPVKSPTLVGNIVFAGNVPSSLDRGGRQAGLVEIGYPAPKPGLAAKEQVARGQTFAFHLRPGVYVPQARISPDGGACIYGGTSSGTVRVRTGHVTHANLYCDWHG